MENGNPWWRERKPCEGGGCKLVRINRPSLSATPPPRSRWIRISKRNRAYIRIAQRDADGRRIEPSGVQDTGIIKLLTMVIRIAPIKVLLASTLQGRLYVWVSDDTTLERAGVHRRACGKSEAAVRGRGGQRLPSETWVICRNSMLCKFHFRRCQA